MDLTPAEVAKIKANLFQYLKITDYASGQPVTYTRNQAQKTLYSRVASAEKASEPVRVIILKARREGVSTAVQMLMLKRALINANFRALTIAHDDDASTELFRMSEAAYEALPHLLKIPKESAEQGRRLYLSNGSRLRVRTAGARGNAGRAAGYRAVHCSEVAWYPDAKATLAAVRQTVPREPGTMIFLESTANGVGNPFHQEWLRAVNGETGYAPVFLPWTIFDAYRLAPPDGFEALDDTEAKLLESLDADQVYWRRVTIANELAGDQDMFDQEYPITPDVAFLTSGRPWFRGVTIGEQAPIRRGVLAGDPERGGGLVRFEDDPHGELQIFVRPKPGHRYIIGADVAGKVTLDEHLERGREDDYCCAQVVDWESGEQVAEWHGRRDPDVFGAELARLGWLYGGALVAVEATGGYGAAPLAALHRRWNYPYLYQRTTITRRDELESQSLGWETSQTTRPVLVDTLRKHLREHPEDYHSAGLASELRTFVVRRNGSPGADSGCHDDRVMALGIALEVRRERVPEASILRVKTRRKQKPLVFAADAAV